MNQRKSKQLKRKAESLLIEWIRTMTPDGEDSTKINKKNLHEFIPQQTHILSGNKLMLSAYSLKWFYKRVKKNPDLTLGDLNA